MYNIDYLPSAKADMVEIVQYISHNLQNPIAAEKLATEMIEAVDGLSNFPYRNRIYMPIRPLKREYRKLLVQNYILFYYVEEEQKLVTIARAIYGRRDYGKLLK